MREPQPDPLVMTAEVYDAMVSHRTQESALACCAILAGNRPLASVIYPMANAAKSTTRYEAAPQDMLRSPNRRA